MLEQEGFNNNLNENEILPQNINNENNIQELEQNLLDNQPFISKLSSRDFIDIINDIIPSLFFIIFLILPFFISPTYCNLNIYLSMKTLIGIYICFIIRGIIKISIIYFNKKKIINYKIFISLLDIVTSLCYYICIYISYLIYVQSNPTCLKLDTFSILTFFTIIFFGIISFFQTCINLIILAINFIFMVEKYIGNPMFFYNQYGMDPEYIQNLSTVKADDKHTGTCIICLKNINIGESILILSCPAKHFFHGDCIKNWLMVKTCCPMCRSELVL